MRLYKFRDIVGNANTIRLMQTALMRNSFPKVILLKGYPGTGKSTAAEISGLSLTCLEPVDGEPCLNCRHCKQNLSALRKDGISPNLIKKNLGKLNSRKDVLEMIKEIFVLKAAMGNNVYILEEAHTLRPDDQTALLEEIDRLDENTYIIMCTTEANKIIAPLRSRAISFEFKRLNNQESKLLFERTCRKLDIKRVSKNTADIIIKHSKGIPRDMVKLIDFIQSTTPSVDQIAEYLGVVSSEDFSNLILAMSISEKETSLAIIQLLESYSHDVIIEQFKSYLLDVLVFITADIKDNLTKADRDILSGILDNTKVYKLCKLVEGISSYKTSEDDLKFLLYRMSLIIREKKISDVYKHNMTNASQQDCQAKKLHKENEKIVTENTGEVAKLNNSAFMNYFKDKE